MSRVVGLTDVASGKPLFPPDGPRGLVYGLWYSADGRSLMSIGRDRRMLAWDVTTQRYRELPWPSWRGLPYNR